MRALCCLIGTALLLFARFAGADTAVTEVTVDGYGGSRQEAVANALAEAVRQVNGVNVDANQFLESSASSSAVSGSDGEHHEAHVSAHVQQGTGIRGAGLLAGYEVISNDPSDVGFTASVRARVLRYTATGLDTAARRKLAVIPRTSLRSRYEVYAPLSGDELTDRYASALEAALVQSRRFAIVDRSENSALAEERSRWRSADAPLADRVKLGHRLGVDYLLFTRVLDAEGGIDHQHVTLTGEDLNRPYASFAIEVRVVLVATGEVKFADTVKLGITDLGAGADPQSLIDAVADRVAASITERIYPLRIINLENNEYVLNQGGRSVVPGERFWVIQRGKALSDPYSHEPLGYSEQQVAVIEVSRVEARVSYARLAEGPPNAVRKGMNLQRVPGSTAPPDHALPPEEPSEGVRLPFDR